MDYPKSVPGVGLVGGKFVDENTATGQQGSLVPSAWGNAVTDEVLSVIQGAGLVPQEGNNAQLLAAINIFMPTGVVVLWPSDVLPYGFLKGNGANVSRSVYARLFAIYGTRYGAGDGVTTFTLPDLRGEFPRFWDDGRGVDAGRTIGSKQGDAIRNLEGGFSLVGGWFDGANGVMRLSSVLTGRNVPDGGAVGKTDDIVFDASATVPTANENRPRNIAFTGLIKYL